MKITRLLPVLLTGILFLIWPSSTGSSQGVVNTPPIDSSLLLDPEIVMLQHDVERLKEEKEKLLKEVIKHKIKKVPVKKVIEKIPDSMSVYVRHPNGDVERIVFNPNEKVPIIDLIVDTIYVKKVTWIRSIFSGEEKGWQILDSTTVKLNVDEKN